jgi:hypothetical protein
MAQVVSHSLSPQMPRIVPGSVHIGFGVNRVTLGQVLHRVLRFSCHYHSTGAPHSYTI